MNYKKTLYVQKEKKLLFVHIGFIFLGKPCFFYKIRLPPITIQGFVELSKCQLESKSVGSVLKDDKSTAIQQN